MNFFNPLGWAFIASLPVILTMYLLKQKFVEKSVPSLFFWSKALNMSKSQQPWQKLRKNILMILQLIATFFLVFALANPYLKAEKQAEDVVIIIDNTLSMQSTDVQKSRLQKAKEEANSLVLGLSNSAKITVVVANNSPHVLINASSDKTLVSEKIKEIEETFSKMDEMATGAIVSMLLKDEKQSIFVFTDRNFSLGEDIDKVKQNVLFGQSGRNMAITLLSYGQDEKTIVSLVKVKNFGDQSEQNSVSLYYDGVLHETKEISLKPNEEKDVYFEEIPNTAKNLEATLMEDDFLKADNAAYAVVFGASKKRVALVTDQNIFLESALKLLPNVELINASIENVSGLKDVYVYIFDGVLPEEIPTNGHIFVINPPEGHPFLKAGKEVEVAGVTVHDKAFLKVQSDFEFDVSKAKKLETPSFADVLLSDRGNPLMFKGELGSQKLLVVGFDLHNSDLPLKKEFPIIMFSIMDYFMPTKTSATESLETGQKAQLNINPNAQTVKVVTPDKKSVILAPPFPPSIFDETAYPGFYTIAEETDTATNLTDFAVNVPISESEISLKNSTENSDLTEKTVYKNSVMANKNITSFFIINVILIILVEWWVFARGY